MSRGFGSFLSGEKLSSLTLEDIAKRAGVSRSTVSRVVNGHKHVSDSIRQRVSAVISETGYRPNMAARVLASQHSMMIGFVLPHAVSEFFEDPYYPILTKGISFGCNQNNYTLALFLFSTKEEEEQFLSRISKQALLDGILVQSGNTSDQQIIDRFLEEKIPTVVIGRPFEPEKVSYVDIDNFGAAFNAVSHLINLGYQRIGTIAGSLNSTVGIDRLNGYIKALEENDMHCEPSLIVDGEFTENGGYVAMQKLLEKNVDAVFAASDVMAVGATRAIYNSGLRVPEDISIIGFDDFPVLNETNLTTIHQPVIDLGIKAVELLIDVIQNGINPPRELILDTRLIVRSSCRKLIPAG